jgi:photosystem II stability/assembly factor-like uncharacterized protein
VVICPSCGRRVSQWAATCPACRASLQDAVAIPPASHGRQRIVVAATVLVTLAAVLAWWRAGQTSAAKLAPASSPITQVGLLAGGRGWALNASRLFLTDDAGQHWRDATPRLPRPDVAPNALDVTALGRSDYWVVSYGPTGDAQLTISRSTDDGASWQESLVPRHGSAAVGDAHLDILTSSRGWLLARIGVTSAANLLATTDGGKTWRYLGTVPFAGSVRFLDPVHGLAVDAADTRRAAELYRTTDGGLTWRPVALPSVAGTAAGSATYDAPQVLDATHAVAAAWLATGISSARTVVIYATDDGGRTWQARRAPADPNAAHYSVPPFPFSAATSADWALYIGPTRYRTRDAGRTWAADQPSPVWLQVLQLTVVSDRQEWALVMHQTCHPSLGPSTGVCSARTLTSTIDGGAHWTALYPGPP